MIKFATAFFVINILNFTTMKNRKKCHNLTILFLLVFCSCNHLDFDKNFAMDEEKVQTTISDPKFNVNFSSAQCLVDILNKDKVAVLMGYVGWKINTNYSQKESSSSLNDLAAFYSTQGIKCNLVNYNSTNVLTSLNNKWRRPPI